jgi:hypothetical protein
MPAKRRHCIPVSTTLTPEQDARLRARAVLQGLSRAQALRSLVEALPEPTPQPAHQRAAQE